MTIATNARIAGVTSLFYMVAGLSALALRGQAQVTGTIELFTSLSAIVLAVTLYAITRDQDPDLALLALVCRAIEGIPHHEGFFFFAVGSALFCWLLLTGRLIPASLAWLGLVGSTLIVVIVPLQRAGVLAGVDFLTRATWLTWLPLFVFEIWLGVWLIAKGVASSEPHAKAA